MTRSGLQFHTCGYKYHYQMHINYLRKQEECSWKNKDWRVYLFHEFTFYSHQRQNIHWKFGKKERFYHQKSIFHDRLFGMPNSCTQGSNQTFQLKGFLFLARHFLKYHSIQWCLLYSFDRLYLRMRRYICS